jgi:2-dehydropantoate 2-reductase
MHFLILGAGTIGCYLGARLAAAGEAVTLVGRARVIDPIRTNGLTVTDLDGFKAHVAADRLVLVDRLSADLFAQPTVVLLCVKGGATSAAARELAAVCPAGTSVISFQNGVENVARIQQSAPRLLALAGMVPYNVIMLVPGTVHRGTTGSLHCAKSDVSVQIQPALQAAGLPMVLEGDMLGIQWGKLLLNLNNPVNALSNLPLRAQLTDRNYRRVVAALQTEALRVLKAAAIAPKKVTTVSPTMLPRVLSLPNWLFTRLAARMLRMDASARSSMWDDLQHGRTTEVGDLCGAVVRLGAQFGVRAPLNDTMCKLVDGYQKGQNITGPALLQAIYTQHPP